MVRLDLAPVSADERGDADLLGPAPALAGPAGSSSESESDGEGPSALSTLAARQSELIRERERREADLRCVLRRDLQRNAGARSRSAASSHAQHCRSSRSAD